MDILIKNTFIYFLLLAWIQFPVADSYSQQVTSNPFNENFRRFEFKFENDFFNKTDYYYTNGLILEYSNPVLSKSPFFKVFSKQEKGNPWIPATNMPE